MIIENTSSTEVVPFYLNIGEKSEYVTIAPGKYIFIDESNWEIEHVKDFVEHIQEDINANIVGNRKNYDIGTEHPTKEKFIDRFDLMDMEE